jgi:hypothetical protein
VAKRPTRPSTLIGGNVMDDFMHGYREGNYDDGLNAYEMAQLHGKPLRFSVTGEGPAPWYDAEDVKLGDYTGHTFFVGKDTLGKWRVIHDGSGLAIGDAAGNKEAAIKNARERMGQVKDQAFMRNRMDRMTADAEEKGMNPAQREQKWLEATREKAENPENDGGETIKSFPLRDGSSRIFEKGQMVYLRDVDGTIKPQLVTRLEKGSNMVGLSDHATGEIHWHEPDAIETENPDRRRPQGCLGQPRPESIRPGRHDRARTVRAYHQGQRVAEAGLRKTGGRRHAGRRGLRPEEDARRPAGQAGILDAHHRRGDGEKPRPA